MEDMANIGKGGKIIFHFYRPQDPFLFHIAIHSDWITLEILLRNPLRGAIQLEIHF